MKMLYLLVLLMSKLPLGILYRVSDVCIFILKYIFHYRKKIIEENLRKSFPEKTTKEIKNLRNQFYKHFADYIVEMVKLFSATPEYINKRVKHIHIDVFQKAKEEKKNVILLTGHIFNWEWYTPLATLIPQDHCFPVYRNIQSDFWREKIKNIRSKFGNEAIEAADVLRHIFRTPNDGNSAYMFVADQSPYIIDVRYGLKFLNQKTPVYIGYDKLATKMDFKFIFCKMKKVQRGKYAIEYQEISPDKDKFQPYELVKKFHQLLEENILQDPANYLWSHRKWKYQHAIRQYEE